jgi:endonuclease III
MYRALQEAVRDQIPRGAAPLSRAHLLLRQHGKTLCRNTRPLCEECPLAGHCAFAAKRP